MRLLAPFCFDGQSMTRTGIFSYPNCDGFYPMLFYSVWNIGESAEQGSSVPGVTRLWLRPHGNPGIDRYVRLIDSSARLWLNRMSGRGKADL
jgi:hypothetical protein